MPAGAAPFAVESQSAGAPSGPKPAPASSREQSTSPSGCERRLVEADARVEIRNLETDVVVHDDLLLEVILGRRGEPFLEDLAVAPGGLAGRPRGETPAARWKVRTKLERSPKPTSKATSVIGCGVVRQQARGAAQARAHQILVRRHAEHAREEAQEVERAEPGLAGRGGQVDRLVRVRVEPERGLDGAAAVPRRARPARRGSCPETSATKRAASSMPSSSSADVAPPSRRGLRQLAEHHQLGERRHAARCARPSAAVADRVDERRREVEREALVAARRDRACRGTRRPDARSGAEPATSSNSRPRVRRPKLPLRT